MTTVTAKAPKAIAAETRLLAAMAYGEASTADDADEIYALASVLKRQRDARGYATMAAFAAGEPSFSFVVGDGNKRYQKFKKASDADVRADAGMNTAIAAAENALANGPDKSNGAWFWDGADIKSNYKKHFKVRQGIRFTDAAHNIYDINESSKLVIKYKITKKKVNGKVQEHKEELYRYDHVYESTAAYGGTIFWQQAPDYLKFTRAKEYK
ncbi:hypothetical protein HA052_19480 [Chromobacterium haemolyticum]|uniref:Uncharacterized protein n=1 Tax=Chromobacterium fluminis TaxID=3044269 RepID=A0ABX0L6P8_9NEIS|nr:hypothetical protein [Chromobacterium haemolyticum]NHR07375.1 hypothetical protein [Chromobacterium haemolyticum]